MSKVTAKLQVTLPKRLAETLGIRPGDEIDWDLAGDMIRITPVAKKRQNQPVSAGNRLHWFDQATRRQRRREKRMPRPLTSPSERGWSREELYS